MTATTSDAGRSRIAGRSEGIGLDELALATRNHGMPLEALRYDVTPPGLHYVLTHYDIPAVDPGTWRLEIGGGVGRPVSPGVARPLRPPRGAGRAPGRGGPRGAAAPAAGHLAGAAGVRRQRTRPLRAPAGQPAVAAR